MVHAVIQTYGKSHRIDCTGHATGSEQVCAAVSGIVSALANYLAFADASILHCKLGKGSSVLEFEGAQEAFDMARVGLLGIAKSYPEYLKVSEIEG